MSYYYKVRNDLSVASLTKIVEELYAITNWAYKLKIKSVGINDLRIILDPPSDERMDRGTMEEIRAAMSVMPPHYLKTLEWES